ncbi:MAG: DUF6314 family protein [Pseudomonadota bacterium]
MRQFADFGEYFDSLVGEWSILRTVSSGEKLQGKLLLAFLDNSSYLVSETGELRMSDGNLISASRQWIWRYENGNLLIYFDEEPPRLYHQMVPVLRAGAWHGQGDHDCPPDAYVGEYLFSANKIIVKQDVMGPKKDYQIVSEYTRRFPIQSS